MNDYPKLEQWRSLRELDSAAGRPKGAAFRAFKSLLPRLIEGRDYRVLDHRTDSAAAARLHAQKQLYRGTVNPVLLSPATAAAVLRDLAAAGQ